MPRTSTDSESRGSLILLVVLVLALGACLATMVARRPVPGAGSPGAVRFPVGKVAAAAADLQPAGSAAPAQSSRPNIVTIVADGMRTDDLRWMPNVRRLITDRGLDFRNSFSPDPLGDPAQASLLSGQYAHDHHVDSYRRPSGFGSFDDRRTLATSLNAAGYNTLFLGRYFDGYGTQKSKATGAESFTYVPPGWTEWRGAVSRPAHSGHRSGGTFAYFHTIINGNGRIDDKHRRHYQTEVLGRMADRLVRKYHRSPKPFFLYLSPAAPHVGTPREKDDPRGITLPGTGAPEPIRTPARPASLRGRFDQQIARASGLPRRGGPSEADVSDKPRSVRALPELSTQEQTAVRTLTRQRAEALAALDQQVGKLVAMLRRTGEYDNTVIMLTSGGGYLLGEHRIRQGADAPYEPALRVPFVVAGPGIPHGTRYDPVTSPGVAATIAQLAGASMPHPADGVSVVPSFGHDRGWTVPVVTEGVHSIGIRTARWTYVRYDDGEGELYDLDRDPNELTNRYGDPRLAAVRRQLAALLARYRACTGASCRAAMPAGQQSTPAQERTSTDQQSRGVLAVYGYGR